MNKYIKMFMDDHNLKVGDEFRAKGLNIDQIWRFDENGCLFDNMDTEAIVTLYEFLLGKYEVEKVKEKLWKPKYGEYGYYINEFGHVNLFYYDASEGDDYLIEHNMIFETKKEANDFKWFLDKVDEYQRPFVPNQDNHFVYFDVDLGIVSIMNHNHSFIHGVVYFGDEKNCTNFIKLVGEERIKKYMFYLWK